MGCCVSTNRGSPHELQSFHQNQSFESRAGAFAAAAIPSAEEETVKQVLSETWKPIAKAPNAHIFIPLEEVNKKTQIQEKESLDFDVKAEAKSPVIEEYSAPEDVSEVCSVSLSESLSNKTDGRVDDDEEEDEDVRQQRVFRSPARSSGSRNRVVGRSPTRKLDQSPSRRNGIVNGGSSKRMAPQTQSRETLMRCGSTPKLPPRTDPGESSGRRRSGPPAVNRSLMGRSPSGRRTNQSPGNSKKVEQQQQFQHGDPAAANAMEGEWPSSNNNGGTTTSAPNESLENPLVSLECFIFL